MPQQGVLARTRCTCWLRTLLQRACVLLTLLDDGGGFLGLCMRPSPALAAEILFLRKQLALYQERHTKPRHVTNVTRFALVWLGGWFDWRHALRIVQPETFMRWHRHGFRLLWRWQSRLTWGQKRIANELLRKPGLRVSPRTVSLQRLGVLLQQYATRDHTAAQGRRGRTLAGAI